MSELVRDAIGQKRRGRKKAANVDHKVLRYDSCKRPSRSISHLSLTPYYDERGRAYHPPDASSS
jgi:hypothetical protein